MTEEKKKVDDEAGASQQREPQQQSEQERLEKTNSYITIFFEAPGSAMIAGLQTQGVSLNQVAIAARELQGIADFEQWWIPYISRMEQVLAQLVEQSLQKMAQQAQEEMVRQALMRGGGLRPS